MHDQADVNDVLRDYRYEKNSSQFYSDRAEFIVSDKQPQVNSSFKCKDSYCDQHIRISVEHRIRQLRCENSLNLIRKKIL